MENIINCILLGEDFSPNRIEKLIDVKFNKKSEKGEIQKKGKFFNKPIPYGFADIVLEDTNYEELLNKVIKFLSSHFNILKSNGVKDILLTLTIIDNGEINMEFKNDVLSLMVKMDVSFSISIARSL